MVPARIGILSSTSSTFSTHLSRKISASKLSFCGGRCTTTTTATGKSSGRDGRISSRTSSAPAEAPIAISLSDEYPISCPLVSGTAASWHQWDEKRQHVLKTAGFLSSQAQEIP